MTTYPELMDILRDDEDKIQKLYNEISTWHSKRIEESNDAVFQYENFLWEIKEAFPKLDEQGLYKDGDVLKLVVAVKEIMDKLGGVWKVGNK